MPPRLELLKKRWSTFDLPILPFLAPRVFKPWPFEVRRTHWQGQQVKKRPRIAGNVDGFRPRYQTPEYGQLSKHEEPQSIQTRDDLGEVLVEVQPPEPVEVSPVEREPDKANLALLKHRESEGEEFLRKYEEIWCTPIEDQPKEPPEDPGPVRRLRSRNLLPKGHKHLEPLWIRARRHWMADRKWQRADARRNILTRVHTQVTLRYRIPEVRPRYISLPLRIRYKFPWTYAEWNRRFAVLNLRYEKFMKGRELPREVLYHALRPKAPLPEAIQKALSDKMSSVIFRQIWDDLDKRMRSNIWPGLMITALEHHPDQALDVLEATFKAPYPPAFAVSNCLEYLVSHEFRGPASLIPKDIIRFVNRIRVLLYLGAQRRVCLPQDSILLLVSRLRAPETRRLWVTLRQINHPLHENTLLQFASHLAKGDSRSVTTALEALQQMRDKDVRLDTPKALSVLSTMLERSDRDTDAQQLDSTILSFMADSGVPPNIITYNILLQNALRDGDFETGWNIYETMIQNGIEPDAFTYSSLLNDAKLRMNPEAIKRVISLVKEKGIRNHHIVTDVLHAIFLLHNDREQRSTQHALHFERRSKPAFDNMLQVYCEYFHTQPLFRLIPSFGDRFPKLLEAVKSSQNSAQLLHPPSPTLVVMLTAYLSDLQRSTGVKTFYDHFNQLLISGNPIAVDLSKQPYIWSVMIMNFSRFGDRLADCPELVGRMLANVKKPLISAEDANSNDSRLSPYQPEFSTQMASHSNDLETPPVAILDSEATSQDTPYPHSFPAPNVYTWSILLKIFMDHQQPLAAEQVLKMMKERNVEPNIVTWNTLIVGYSKMQDTLSAVDALRRMENAGIKPDDITMKALSKMQDKRTMIAAMEMNERLRAQDTNQQAEQQAQSFSGDSEDAFGSDDLIEQWERADQSLEPDRGNDQEWETDGEGEEAWYDADEDGKLVDEESGGLY
ncbi:uncharacterized protein PAC_10264 [Phialocephala subalpina]|uniref:Pentatricopeptide repeat protein n=1 Tax=Phialocephala subalpina TaxID=576137 RepID=A0A1L7X5Q4_9HELO|nr:uncharacterized protein PAC_10264 [Phialocephala subalpina]